MRHIAVIGNAGGGKSTLCMRLGQVLDIPVYYVHTQARPHLLALLDTFRNEKQVIDIRSPRQLRRLVRTAL